MLWGGIARQAKRKGQTLLASCLDQAKKSLQRSRARGPDRNPRARPAGPERPAPEVPDHPHKNAQVLVTSLEMGPAEYGTRGVVQKVHQAEGQEPTYWLMVENDKGQVRCIHAPASLCTHQADLPANPTAPAPFQLDNRAKTTKDFFQHLRQQMLGNQVPSSLALPSSGRDAEIGQLSCLLEEITTRVDVPDTVAYFGPLACRIWNQAELTPEDEKALGDAFQPPKTVVQMVLWGEGHYGSLEFHLAAAPVDWVQAYEPPRVWQCQFYDPLPGGHAGLTRVCQQLFQHVRQVTNLQGDVLPAPAVPQGWFQKDGWSCGYWSARFLELQRRRLRGELPTPAPSMESYVTKNRTIWELLQKLQRAHKGIPGPLQPSGPENEERGDPKGPGDGQGEDHKAPGNVQGEDQKRPPRSVHEPASLEEAMARAERCPSCKPRKTGIYAGQKGCQKCMGSHFETMRTRKAKDK